MPQRTNPFQELVASIMAVFNMPEYRVEESVLVKNPKTGAVRELDVLITNQRDPRDRILVECRDHQRKQDVQWIDQLEGKARRLGVGKTVAVSSSGFYDTAVAEAKDRGIETLHLKAAEERDWRHWQWGLASFGLNLRCEPVVTKVELQIHPQFRDRFPSDADPSDINLVHVHKKMRCPLKDWIRGYLRDPKTIAELEAHDVPNATSHYVASIPFGPGVGVAVAPDGPILPLIRLVLFIDSTSAHSSFPLRHYDANGKQVLVGETAVLGQETRVVLHEQEGLLKVVLEQRRSPSHDGKYRNRKRRKPT